MARPAPSELDEGTFPVPASVRFPVELTPPDGFDPARLETWPRVAGRLEWVAGRLLYMPPCGERQSWTVADAVGTLFNWARAHPGFVLGTNEPGILLRDDVRAADAAIWGRANARPASPGVARVPPLLAVEVAGRDEGEAELRQKARWYLDVGVAVVWILLPKEREVLVVTSAGESRHRMGERLPSDPHLHDLAHARQLVARRARLGVADEEEVVAGRGGEEELREDEARAGGAELERRIVPVLHHQLEGDHPSRREGEAHGTRLPDALHQPALCERALTLVLHGRGQAKHAVEERRVGVEDDLVDADGRDRQAEAIARRPLAPERARDLERLPLLRGIGLEEVG